MIVNLEDEVDGQVDGEPGEPSNHALATKVVPTPFESEKAEEVLKGLHVGLALIAFADTYSACRVGAATAPT